MGRYSDNFGTHKIEDPFVSDIGGFGDNKFAGGIEQAAKYSVDGISRTWKNNNLTGVCWFAAC